MAPIQICHCSQCRRAQGTPFASNIPIKAAAFRLLSGAELLSSFESSPGKRRVFCGTCGSPLYSQKDAVPDVLRIRAGLIDGPLEVRPVAHAYVASKADWWCIADGLPQFEGPAIPPPSTPG
ncbi:GFA family protein [Pseudomonas sp. RIT-PI-AD]|uniref:GFA family protein n=1 Tax=Pseudomonas sp. RIT-PI-AD TaxID=3035294 RepID=UPI0032082045